MALGKDYNQQPVGTGPFKFVSWEHNQRVTLEANPDYFEEGLPYLDRVITGCRWDLEDERDALGQPGPQAFEWARSRGRAAPPTPRRREGQLVSIVHLSCIVRDLRLAECRADHQLPVSGPHGSLAARNMNGERLAAPDPAAVEGRVVYLTTETEQMLVR